MMVDPRRVGYWAPHYGEPLRHFNGKLRLKKLLEDREFNVYPEYQLDPYWVNDLGERQYREDLFAEHKTIEYWRMLVTVYGGVHFNSRRQMQKTKFRKQEIESHEDMPVVEFTDEELIGKHKMDDHDIRRRLGLDIF